LASLLGTPITAQASEPTCLGQQATILGTSGADTIAGTAGSDVIVGLAGADLIDGLGGNDLLCGSEGGDSLSGRAGSDQISGGSGNDLLSGGPGSDAATGGVGIDSCLDGEKATACEPPTEGDAFRWGTFAIDGAEATVSDDSARVQAGARAVRFDTRSGFDTGVTYPVRADAHWDLRSKNYLMFWAYAVNDSPNGFQGKQPVVVLRTTGGSYTFEPQQSYGLQPTVMYDRAWHLYHVPLAGDDSWTRTATGSPTLADVNSVEIHQDTWDFGFTIYYDGLQFARLSPGGLPSPGPPPPAGVNPDAITPKVLLFIYDPIMENKGGQRMHAAYGWGDPTTLAQSVVADLRTNSHGLLRYRIVDTKIVDDYPFFEDGYQYDDQSFDEDWQARTPYPSHFDYRRFIADNGIAARIASGAIDEVWVYAFPYAGLWESTMAGDGGYWCNSGPVKGVPSERLFVVMGFNYERGVAEALHSYGHRVESIMVHSYGDWESNQDNSWNKFTLLHKDAPGLGGVGNVHFPVNGESDYDYANPRFVPSNADDWYNYPNFRGIVRSINYREWSPQGIDPQREYLNWWYNHIPHMSGRGPDYFLNSWWRYIADPDQFKGWDGNLFFASGVPSVSTVSPASGATVSGRVLVRVAVDAEQDGAIGRVDLYVDGIYQSSDTMAPYSFPWSTAGLRGKHTLVTKAYELQNGTEAVSAPISVTVSQVLRQSR
jgi:hypothetical protein